MAFKLINSKITETDHVTSFVLANGDTVEVTPEQFVVSSESGKMVQLWWREPLWLLKQWRRSSVLFFQMAEKQEA